MGNARFVSKLDRMFAKDCPVGAASLASALHLAEQCKGSEFMKIAEARLQTILVATPGRPERSTR